MMRAGYDAATKWPEMPDWRDAAIHRPAWHARALSGLHLLLVSGDPARLHERLPLPEAGLWSVEPASALRLRVARDRVLLVSAAPLPLAPGWHAEGFAVSDTSDATAVFEIAGPDLEAVVREAVSAAFEQGSPSAATLFAGASAFLYRTSETTARLFVDAPLGAYVWRWLDTRPA